MSPTKIQCDYDALMAIARQLDNQADEIQFLLRRVARCVYTLETGDWVGVGADSFFDEMHDEVFPAMRRLINALEDAAYSARYIHTLFRDAEQEASQVFR